MPVCYLILRVFSLLTYLGITLAVGSCQKARICFIVLALAALCRLDNLKVLDLSSNAVDGDILPHFKTCSLSSLEELRLSSIYPKFVPVLTAFCQLKNLRSLDLSNNNINDENAPTCLLKNLSSLEILDLSGNRLLNSPRILTALCSLRNLRRLDLSELSG
nr:receptor-like protein 9b isoform X3 [Coffea arabica]